MKTWIWILVLACLWISYFTSPSSAQSNVIKVDLISVAGENALTKSEALQSFKDTARIYAEETGLVLELAAFRRVGNPFGKWQQLSQQIPLLYKWQGWFQRHGPSNTILHMAITPPLRSRVNGKKVYWIAGVANGTCRVNRFGVGYATGEMKNQDGAARYVQSVVAVAHEVGHLLGASHDNTLPATIMNIAASSFVESLGGVMHFSQLSVNQIRQCVGVK